jgi:histone H1/5
MATTKVAPAHPPYVAMITAAVKALKDRTGSSLPAIGKYIGATYKVPAGFEKTLSQQLKRLAAAGKLVRVKASYKLGEALKVVPKPKKVVKKKVVKVRSAAAGGGGGADS